MKSQITEPLQVCTKKIVALSGGVGGAKLVFGLSKLLDPKNFATIVNTGDDFLFSGLKICPDLDSVCYSLAGLSNPINGWGRINDTWNCYNEIKKINPDVWFHLGDMDLALQIERTRLLSLGMSLTEVTKIICKKLLIESNVLPMTDNEVSTIIKTEEYGDLPFQEYFVKNNCIPKIINFEFKGIKEAQLSKESLFVLNNADVIIICPSNPWLSIMPILGLENVKRILEEKISIAVSPIIGKRAIKGPTAKIFREFGVIPSALEVAKIYEGLIDGIVIDYKNIEEEARIKSWGIIPLVTETLMADDKTKVQLAENVIDFALRISEDTTK
ncbi:MAG: 2-phospho-L-lactate transferase [Chloroflexi bacterium]|nr:2-phospho-L-lactate transferase [Chloroflexota bacterium]